MKKAKLSSKSQIVIPADVRRALDLRVGDHLVVEIRGDQILLTPAPRSHADRLEALSGRAWKGASEELDRSRSEWEE